MTRDRITAALLTIFSVLLWLLAVVTMSLGQAWSACYLFVGSGLLLVWPALLSLREADGEQ